MVTGTRAGRDERGRQGSSMDTALRDWSMANENGTTGESHKASPDLFPLRVVLETTEIEAFSLKPT